MTASGRGASVADSLERFIKGISGIGGCPLYPRLAALWTPFRSGLRMPRAWLAVGAVGLLDAIWADRLDLTLDHYQPFVAVIIILLASTMVLHIARPRSRLGLTLEVFALWLAFAQTNNLLSYLTATAALPLRDNSLAQLDRMLGFNWLAMFRFVRAHQLVAHVLSADYASLIPEAFALGILLVWTRRQDRVRELFWLALLSSLLTSVIAGCVPALGAFPHYGMPAKALYLHNLRELRSGVGLRFSLLNMPGAVQFPSYHATLALLMMYVVRGMRTIGIAVVFWNLMMLVSTMPDGGHYLVDLVGGAGVLLISIAAFTWTGEHFASGVR